MRVKRINIAIIEKDPQNPELYKYAETNNPFIIEAAKNACQSGCGSRQTGVVIVKNNEIITNGYNAANRQSGHCPRVEQNLASGQGYELCLDCGPEYHAEADAVRNGQQKNISLKDADLYLWGHWWACLPCWRKMLTAGISQVFLVKGARQIFNHRGPLIKQKWYWGFQSKKFLNKNYASLNYKKNPDSYLTIIDQLNKKRMKNF